MTWPLVPIVLALAATAAAAADTPRLQRAEGDVRVGARLVQTAAGRAATTLADGTLVHLDADTSLQFLAPDLLELSHGRVVIQTGHFGALRITHPLGALRLAPDGSYRITVDHRRSRLLVAVDRGVADVTTRYGSTTPVRVGQQVVMLGATAIPWAAGAVPVALDAFELWAAAGTPPAARPFDAGTPERPAAGTIPPAGLSGTSHTEVGVWSPAHPLCGWGPCAPWPAGYLPPRPWPGRPSKTPDRPVPPDWTDHPDFLPAYEPDAAYPRPASGHHRRGGDDPQGRSPRGGDNTGTTTPPSTSEPPRGRDSAPPPAVRRLGAGAGAGAVVSTPAPRRPR